MKAQFERRSEFQLNDSAEFYFNDVERLSAPDYLPSTDDVLRSRVRTTGIVQSEFIIKGIEFAMFDVGGQRNERRKWIHCFDNVDAVVFVASLSEFDQVLFEDETQNRLDEALDLFKQIVNSKWFKDTSMILFLNKKDLFEQKLKSKVFADYVNKNDKRDPYTGPNEMMPCAEYTKKIFLEKNGNADKSIYSHITTAIDTSNVKFVFSAVVGMILEQNLKSSGLAG
jgi:GTPase SAR1 family protein